MGDGMGDAAGVGRLAKELRETTEPLRLAIKAAVEGYHGFSPNIEDEVNFILADTGFKLIYDPPKKGGK